ncbi:MAG TPA: hypothetical protein VG602_09960 [Actinomycetota bacterium]|nr:hypothetical protein [Actinomycetota bacterium]
MRTLLCAALALAGAGCTDAPKASDPTARAVAIYSTVVKHMVTEEGQPSGFPIVYILDHSVAGAADPDGATGVIRDFPAQIRARLQRALAPVARVEFISDRESVIGPPGDGSRVEGGGILVTLGPIHGEGDRVEVAASSYLGNLAGTWQTWVVEMTADRWRVTGTKGPVAIS